MSSLSLAYSLTLLTGLTDSFAQFYENRWFCSLLISLAWYVKEMKNNGKMITLVQKNARILIIVALYLFDIYLLFVFVDEKKKTFQSSVCGGATSAIIVWVTSNAANMFNFWLISLRLRSLIFSSSSCSNRIRSAPIKLISLSSTRRIISK